MAVERLPRRRVVRVARAAPGPRLVLQTIAKARLRRRLREHIADKRVLAVLDNFEQLSTLLGARGAASAPAPTCDAGHEPGAAAIAPSASTPAAVRSRQAVELFRRARTRAQTEFEPTASPEICDRVDNLPLAIELAAARVTTVSADAFSSGSRSGFHSRSRGT